MNLRVLGKGQKPKFIDWFLSLGMLLTGSYFVAWGIYLITSYTTFGLVLLIFGLIGLINVKNDFKNYSGRYKNKKLLDADSHRKNDWCLYCIINSIYHDKC
tara:strand:- start:5 stop:307 length:303 start_codon:yes stop_codon:yes gene_type:complete